ncbi:WecB/TagA/CpsF family glycosyltransferase [Bacillaceae bacterium IKA-2]|nr:WecB/TagA/CpsF family glycosyltransferase [Bacillaceae bacterium IKA-2]
MNLETKELFDIKFLNIDLTSFVDVLKKHIEEKKKAFIITANPITVLNFRDDDSFKAAVKSANYITPDGVGILLAAKFLKKPLKERVTGYDLMIKLLEIANQNSYKVYLYGAHQNILKLAVENINLKYPNVKICGHCDGYQAGAVELLKISADIKAKKPDLIFVALGVPKQELWIKNNLDQFEEGVFIGVGGSFDVLSGQTKRAPIGFQKLGIEWLYRVITQPSRLKRLTFIPGFFIDTLKQKYK